MPLDVDVLLSELLFTKGSTYYGMVWYGMVNVDLYSAVITKVSNALNTLVSGESQVFRPCLKDS